MTKSRLAILLIGCVLTLTACERRDLDKDSSADENTESTASEEESSDEKSGDEAAKGGDEQPDEDDAKGEDEPEKAASKDEDTPKPTGEGDGAPVVSWKTCTDGAARAYLCDFEGGGGAAVCASDAFVELRLARPDGGQSVHRHTGGDQASTELCQFSSPQRTDASLTFYEQGQTLMFETHYVNPDSDYAEGADGSTQGAVTLAPAGGDQQTWTCAKLAEEDTGGLEDSAAVARRDDEAETCEAVREPRKAIVRGAPHQDRKRDGARCGGDAAPDAFVDKAAQAHIENIRFSAENPTGDREARATYTVASFDTPGGSFSESIASCSKFFERVRSDDEPDTFGSPPFQVHADVWRLRYDGHTIVDGSRDVCVDFCGDESARAGDFIASSLDGLSHVGPVFAYKKSTSEAAAGGPPYHGDSWGTVDLRSMQPAALDALVEPESVLESLRNDSVIRRNEELSKAVSDAQSLDAAIAALEEAIGATGAYAFHYYNERENVVAMRIAFRETTAGLSPNRMSQIGIWVTPREEWIAAFKAARNAPQGGFYMTTSELSF